MTNIPLTRMMSLWSRMAGHPFSQRSYNARCLSRTTRNSSVYPGSLCLQRNNKPTYIDTLCRSTTHNSTSTTEKQQINVYRHALQINNGQLHNNNRVTTNQRIQTRSANQQRTTPQQQQSNNKPMYIDTLYRSTTNNSILATEKQLRHDHQQTIQVD